LTEVNLGTSWPFGINSLNELYLIHREFLSASLTAGIYNFILYVRNTSEWLPTPRAVMG